MRSLINQMGGIMSDFSNSSFTARYNFVTTSKTYSMYIPQGHQQVMPYLILSSAGRFIEFTKAIFGAELLNTHMRDDNKTIMHAEIKIGDTTIMFADASDQYPPAVGGFFVYVNDADKSYALALEEGATSIMGLSDQSYGRTCGVLDPTGNTWWITSVKA